MMLPKSRSAPQWHEPMPPDPPAMKPPMVAVAHAGSAFGADQVVLTDYVKYVVASTLEIAGTSAVDGPRVAGVGPARRRG